MRPELAQVSFRRVGSGASDRDSSSLPPDLQNQVRGRVRLLALFFIAASGFDLAISTTRWIGAALGYQVPPAIAGLGAQWINLSVVAMSVGLWWAARRPALPASRLLTIGLSYEVAICFAIAITTNWQYYAEHGITPNMTWVPGVVILFPLILPGPPRRMLGAAVAAGAMAPLSLVVLQRLGVLEPDAEAYVQASISSAFAVGFASIGARIIYGLGREVAEARELGSYLLEQKLGQGGMGEVWRARHRLLARPAAVKLIRASLDQHAHPAVDEAVWRRFEREAQATAQLRSPHTVELFDFGVANDGTFYYVMELLDGLDADSLVRRFGPVPTERAVHLMRQVCHSLSEAEARGLVHRDIKPANIFVCTYGEDVDFVKVLDFGLVTAQRDLPTAETRAALTAQDVVHGTPAFISPEQALGLANVDGRSDIYAAGCVLYWLLTGELVFASETALGYLVQHAHQAPTAPSTRTDRPIPADIDALVLSCLEKDPSDRPQSARELARRLSEIDVPAPWTERRARDWWDAHRDALSRPG